MVDLTQAELVYLSSCDSARAVPGSADELMALTRAFLYAGTRTVLATLWTTESDAAYDFARYFYKAWTQEKISLAAAYQQAMLQTRTLYEGHPLHWAPFVLIGAWR
jgi:CHAT domain-containing protein